MDESLGSDVHYWDFNSSFGLDLDSLETADVVSSDVGSLEESSNFVINVKSVVGVLGSDLGDLILPDGGS